MQFIITFNLMEGLGFHKIFYIYVAINSMGLLVHFGNLWKGTTNPGKKVSLG